MNLNDLPTGELELIVDWFKLHDEHIAAIHDMGGLQADELTLLITEKNNLVVELATGLKFFDGETRDNFAVGEWLHESYGNSILRMCFEGELQRRETA